MITMLKPGQPVPIRICEIRFTEGYENPVPGLVFIDAYCLWVCVKGTEIVYNPSSKKAVVKIKKAKGLSVFPKFTMVNSFFGFIKTIIKELCHA